jgi:hypothetical protein
LIDKTQLSRYAEDPDCGSLIPLHRWDDVLPGGRPGGKVPLDHGWQRVDYQTPEQLARLTALIEAGHSVGVRPEEETLIFDWDRSRDPDGFELAEFEAILKRDGQRLADFPLVRTGGGGLHIHARAPEGGHGRRRHALLDLGSIEVKGPGRQVVAAGSKHPSGSRYVWETDVPLSARPRIGPGLVARAYRPARGAASAEQAAGKLTAAQVAGLLDQLDPVEFRDHGEWLDLGFACWHATEGSPDGCAAFVRWSVKDPMYASDGAETESRWETWDYRGEPEPRTVGTLLKAVREAGGVVGVDVYLAVEAAEDRFEYVDLEPGEGAPEPGVVEGDPREVGPDTPLHRLNLEWACLIEEGEYRIVRWKRTQINKKNQPKLDIWHLQRFKRAQWLDWVAPLTVQRGDREVLLGPLWLRWPGRRQYDGVDVRPDMGSDIPSEDGGSPILNLWRGWGVRPAPGVWPLLDRVLREALCAGSEVSYDYVLRWIAWGVQNPVEPAEVALVFKGKKGTGKGTLGRLVMRMFGNHGVPVSNANHLVGYNGFLEQTLMVFADEALYAGNHQHQGILKSLITEDQVSVEEKFQPRKTVRNMLKLIMATNEEWAVPASFDERRFAVMDVDPIFMGDRAFWNAYYVEEDGGGAAAFLHDMLAMRLDGWHPRQDVPTTAGRARQVLASMDSIDRWWFQVLREGELPGRMAPDGARPEDWETNSVDADRAILRRSVEEFVRRERRSGDAGPARALGDLTERLRERAGVEIVRIRQGVERLRAYRVPPLPTCRAAFEAALGAPVDWEE